MNRKRIFTDSNALAPKHEDFSKGLPEMSDTKPFTASKGWSHRLRDRFGLRNIKMTGEAASTDEEVAVVILAELTTLIGVRYYPWIQVSTGGPGACPPQIRRDCYIDFLEKGSKRKCRSQSSLYTGPPLIPYFLTQVSVRPQDTRT